MHGQIYHGSDVPYPRLLLHWWIHSCTCQALLEAPERWTQQAREPDPTELTCQWEAGGHRQQMGQGGATYSVSGSALKHSLPWTFHMHHAVLITCHLTPPTVCTPRETTWPWGSGQRGNGSPEAESFLTTFMTLLIWFFDNYFCLWESISVIRELGCVLWETARWQNGKGRHWLWSQACRFKPGLLLLRYESRQVTHLLWHHNDSCFCRGVRTQEMTGLTQCIALIVLELPEVLRGNTLWWQKCTPEPRLWSLREYLLRLYQLGDFEKFSAPVEVILDRALGTVPGTSWGFRKCYSCCRL